MRAHKAKVVRQQPPKPGKFLPVWLIYYWDPRVRRWEFEAEESRADLADERAEIANERGYAIKVFKLEAK